MTRRIVAARSKKVPKWWTNLPTPIVNDALLADF